MVANSVLTVFLWILVMLYPAKQLAVHYLNCRLVAQGACAHKYAIPVVLLCVAGDTGAPAAAAAAAGADGSTPAAAAGGGGAATAAAGTQTYKLLSMLPVNLLERYAQHDSENQGEGPLWREVSRQDSAPRWHQPRSAAAGNMIALKLHSAVFTAGGQAYWQ